MHPTKAVDINSPIATTQYKKTIPMQGNIVYTTTNFDRPYQFITIQNEQGPTFVEHVISTAFPAEPNNVLCFIDRDGFHGVTGHPVLYPHSIYCVNTRIIYNTARSHTYRARPLELVEASEIDDPLKEPRPNVNFAKSPKLWIHSEDRIRFVAVDRADILCKEGFNRCDHKSPDSF